MRAKESLYHSSIRFLEPILESEFLEPNPDFLTRCQQPGTRKVKYSVYRVILEVILKKKDPIPSTSSTQMCK